MCAATAARRAAPAPTPAPALCPSSPALPRRSGNTYECLSALATALSGDIRAASYWLFVRARPEAARLLAEAAAAAGVQPAVLAQLHAQALAHLLPVLELGTLEALLPLLPLGAWADVGQRIMHLEHLGPEGTKMALRLLRLCDDRSQQVGDAFGWKNPSMRKGPG